MPMNEKLPIYGGQAVIEGVMMRGAQSCAIAVRAPDLSIVLKREELGRLYRSRLTRIPFVRGLFVLWDALGLGIQALTFSANVQSEENEQMDGASVVFTLLVSLGIGIGFFFLLPAGVAYLLEAVTGWSNLWTNVIEGFTRLALLIGYIWAIGKFPEIRRVFGYHGAEHKTINAFEADAPLEVESVAQFPREHPRCGTAFLLTVVLFSIILFSLLGPMPLFPRLMSRILLIPVIAAVAYEYIRLTAKWIKYGWAKPLIYPNLWLQRLTTREPDEEMIEVAIAAFNSMREGEQLA
jgi:uncharacterized protein YqhQ